MDVLEVGVSIIQRVVNAQNPLSAPPRQRNQESSRWKKLQREAMYSRGLFERRRGVDCG